MILSEQHPGDLDRKSSVLTLDTDGRLWSTAALDEMSHGLVPSGMCLYVLHGCCILLYQPL